MPNMVKKGTTVTRASAAQKSRVKNLFMTIFLEIFFDLFELIDRAENWLKTNHYSNKILKWDTPLWGEIPADFGRK